MTTTAQQHLQDEAEARDAGVWKVRVYLMAKSGMVPGADCLVDAFESSYRRMGELYTVVCMVCARNLGVTVAKVQKNMEMRSSRPLTEESWRPSGDKKGYVELLFKMKSPHANDERCFFTVCDTVI